MTKSIFYIFVDMPVVHLPTYESEKENKCLLSSGSVPGDGWSYWKYPEDLKLFVRLTLKFLLMNGIISVIALLYYGNLFNVCWDLLCPSV